MGGQMRIAVVMTIALTMGCCRGGCRGALREPKYSTPAQVVAAYEKAHDAGDDGAGLDCMSPEGQDKCLKFMVGMELATRQTEPGAPAPTPEEKKAQADMDALLAKHGIKDLAKRAGEEEEACVNRITAHVTDQPHARGQNNADDGSARSRGTKPAPMSQGRTEGI